MTAGALRGPLKCGWDTSTQRRLPKNSSVCAKVQKTSPDHESHLGVWRSEDSVLHSPPPPCKVRLTKAQLKSKEELLFQRQLLRPNGDTSEASPSLAVGHSPSGLGPR